MFVSGQHFKMLHKSIKSFLHFVFFFFFFFCERKMMSFTNVKYCFITLSRAMCEENHIENQCFEQTDNSCV